MVRIRSVALALVAVGLLGAPVAGQSPSAVPVSDGQRWCVDVHAPAATLTPEDLAAGIRDGSVTITGVVGCEGVVDPASVRSAALELIGSHVVPRLEVLQAAVEDRSSFGATEAEHERWFETLVATAASWGHDELIWDRQMLTGAMQDQVPGLRDYVEAVQRLVDAVVAAPDAATTIADDLDGSSDQLQYIIDGIKDLADVQIVYMKDRLKH